MICSLALPPARKHRGAQTPDIYSVLVGLEGNGIGGAVVWSAEDSAASGFTIESNIGNILHP